MSETGFDYVIVGGGTAGGVLAARLTEDPSVRVLVLEAGPDHRSLMMRIPAGVVGLYQAGKYHWDYVAEPEEHAGGKVLPYKMGKILGGSSSINAMHWVRGAPAVYDGWAAAGCTGWSYAEVEKIYRRIERFSDTNDPHMGMAGPISITRGDPNSSVLNVAFLEAAAQAGYVPTDNPNGPNQEGGAVLQRNTIRGERSDVYRGYIQPARNRSNLTIRCGVRAEKILVEDGRASGVVYRDGGGQHMVSPAREVLLCCGTIASAQLLMLSGIGDPEQIVPHGIALRHELPGVGKNLHTHPAIRVGHETTQPVSLLPWTKPPRKWVAGVEWLLKRTGMAATNHMDAGLWFKTDPALPYADAQITFTPLVLDAGYGDGEIHGFDIYLELVGVRSRGAVTLRSAEPSDRPVLRFNFLTDERDLVAFRKSTRIMREIAAQPAFDAWRGRELYPGTETQSDDAIDAWIRKTANISHHIAGTCRMGAPDHPDTVVGPDLKVRGLDGLRVADNSIMPFVSNGNTHAPAIMIGEKASDIIRGERNA